MRKEILDHGSRLGMLTRQLEVIQSLTIGRVDVQILFPHCRSN